MHKTTLDFLAIPCLLTNDTFQIIDSNHEARKVFGRHIAPDKYGYSSKSITRLVVSDLSAFLNWVRLENSYKKPILVEIQCADKPNKFLVSHNQHVVDNEIAFFFTLTPVSEQIDNSPKIDLYRKTFERSNQSIYVTDADHNILFVNPSFTHFFGRSLLEVKGKKDNLLYHPSEQQIHDQAINLLLNDVDQTEERISCVTAFDVHSPIVCSVNIVMIHDEGSHKFLHFIEDITEQITSEKSMKDAAYADPLTGIANRYSFNVKFNELFMEAQRSGTQISLFFLDLDKFKFVNDEYGHDYGDALLIHVSERLKRSCSKNDFIARLGGDEFVILIQNDQPRISLESIAKRILSDLSKPFLLKDLEYRCTCSIGIAQYPNDSISQNDLLNAADSAMYAAKKLGRNDFAFYNHEKQQMTSLHEHRLKEIEEALNVDSVQLYFQPIHNMVTREVISFEALARYIDIDGKKHEPSYFLPFIENDPLMYKLGAIQIKEVKRYLKILKHHGVQLPISINLSSYQIKSEEVMKQLILVAKQNPDIVRFLKIEIIETILFENDSIAIKNLNYLHSLGYSLILDDFGTGHSSIYSLKKIPFEAVKIDKIFIEEINNSSRHDKKFLNAIIAMIKNLNTNIICEGIENQQQVDYLLQRGCTIGQGFYYSKAIPRHKVLTYLGA